MCRVAHFCVWQDFLDTVQSSSGIIIISTPSPPVSPPHPTHSPLVPLLKLLPPRYTTEESCNRREKSRVHEG